jgi:hypothetical protein
MPPTPWVTLAPARPERDYLVMLSYLPLARFRKLPAFFRYVQAIRAQLRETQGVLGYSLHRVARERGVAAALLGRRHG